MTSFRPALGGYRHRVLLHARGRDMTYPAVVDAEVFGQLVVSGCEGYWQRIGELFGVVERLMDIGRLVFWSWAFAKRAKQKPAKPSPS